MALLTLEWNYIPLMRGQAPIDYPLQKIPCTRCSYEKVGDKVIKGAIDYNQFNYTNLHTLTSFVLNVYINLDDLYWAS